METQTTSTLLQECCKNTLAAYLCIICPDYVLRTSIGIMKYNCFKLTKERSRRYPAQLIMDADYADDIAHLANKPTQAKIRLHSLERTAAGIGLHIKANKTDYMSFNRRGDISTLNGNFGRVHLPTKQCLINRDRHHYATSKGMNSY